MKEQLSEEAMLADLRMILTGIVERLSYIFHSEKTQPEGGPWVFGLNLQEASDGGASWEPDLLDIDSLSISQTMKALYRYGVEGIYPTGAHLDDVLMDGIDFVESVRGAARTDINNSYGEGNGICGLVVDRALARWRLAGSEDLSFREVALLCGLDERTVRNAASAKSKGRLNTTVNAEGKTMISATDAYAWMSTKKGFKPTAYPNDDSRRSDDELGSSEDFFIYIREKREELGLSCEEAGTALGVFNGVHCWVKMENGGRPPELGWLPKLSEVLKVDEAWLTKAVMKIFYPRQLSQLVSSVAGEQSAGQET